MKNWNALKYVVLIVVMALSGYYLWQTYSILSSLTTMTNTRMLKRALMAAGSKGMEVMWIALGFWIATLFLKRFGSSVSTVTKQFGRSLVVTLRENHRILGWGAVMMSFAHSSFYTYLWWTDALRMKSMDVYTGFAAMGGMLLLAIYGEILQWKGRQHSSRKVHLFLAMVTVAGVIMHDPGSVGQLILISGITFGVFVLFWIRKSKPATSIS